MTQSQADQTVSIGVKATGSEEAVGSFAKVGQSLRNMQREQRKSGEMAIERMVKGGIVGGLGVFAAETVAGATEKIDEANKKYREGNITLAERNIEIMKSIPLFGIGVRIEESLRDLLTHEKEDREDIRKTIEATHESMKRLSETERDIQERRRAHAGEMALVAERQASRGLFGEEKANAEVDQRAKKAMQDEDIRYEKEKNADLKQRADLLKNAGNIMPDVKDTPAERINKQTRVRNLTAALEQANRDRQDKEKSHGDQMGKIARDQADDRAELARDYIHRESELETRAESQRAKNADAGAQEALRNEGRYSEARIEELRAGAKHRIDEIERLVKEEERKNPTLTPGIQAKARQEVLAEQQRRDQAIAEEERNLGYERADLVAETEKNIADVRAKAADDQLRASGKFHEAELAEIQRHETERLKEIDIQQQKELAQHGENADAIKDKAESERAEATADATRQIRDLQGKMFREFSSQGGASGSVGGRLTGAGMISSEMNNPARALAQATAQNAALAARQREATIAKLDGILQALKASPVVQSLLGTGYGGNG